LQNRRRSTTGGADGRGEAGDTRDFERGEESIERSGRVEVGRLLLARGAHAVWAEVVEVE
jgi:hypothetical protein